MQKMSHLRGVFLFRRRGLSLFEQAGDSLFHRVSLSGP